jgi:biopolymer transport protein TolR
MEMASGSNRPQADMNVTPLIDVLLVLLIIFMVVVPQVQRGELADIPQPAVPQKAPLAPEQAIVIHVQGSNDGAVPSLDINGQKTSWEALPNRLHDLLETQIERVAFVKGDSDVDFQYIASAVDIAQHSGANRVGLLDPHSGTK